MTRIKITIGPLAVYAELRDTPTAKAILESLPVKSTANTWGEEVYFEVPARADLEPDAAQVVEPGTVCFWVHGHSIALPFGPTPISKGNECRLADKCNIIGKLEGDPNILEEAREGDAILVECVKA